MATFKDKNHKPKVAPPDFDRIPAEIRKVPHWVLWKFDWVEETKQWAKVPYSAHGGRAKSNEPATWASFDRARFAFNANEHAGVGFVFSDKDEFCGIDFDNCVEGGHATTEAAKWIERLDSYTEVSATGTGVHVIARAKCSKGLKRNAIEVYDRLRYFAFSGNSWTPSPKPIANRQREVDELITSLVPKEPIPAKVQINVGRTASELLETAFNARNGASIKRLYDGDTSGYGNDDSSADLALASKLAFYSGGDPALLDEMFRGSKLYRRKWDTRHSADGRTYGQMTIDRAFAGCTEFYAPSTKPPKKTETEPPTPGIYRIDDLRPKVLELYRTGRQGGQHPGWNELAKLYTVKKGQFTVLTGVPGSGKSAFLDAMLMNLALKYGWKFAVCSVENQPIEQHISVLTELHLGMPFSAGPTQRMNEDDLEESLYWLNQHFTFVLPQEDSRTLEGVISCVAELEVDGVVVDPWNELEHRRPVSMTETEYVSQALSRMRHHARLFDQHWWLVAHPTKLQKDKATGKYNIPTLYDISGSANFRNKADFGLVAWRDIENEAAPTVIFVQKVRFRWCGQIGSCELYFDKVTGRYSERPNVYAVPRREFV